ncbi:MAG: hypothetical protein U0324_36405 [Polyangiales bacterium]
MSDRTYRTTVSADQLVSWTLLIGLIAGLLGALALGSVRTGLSFGAGLGIIAAVIVVNRRVTDVRVDDEGVTLTRRGRVERIPHAQILQVIAEPAEVSSLGVHSHAIRITLLREGGAATHLEVDGVDADALLAEIAAPMVRRWRATLARGEHLEFRDPRLFPAEAVLRGVGVAAGAAVLLVVFLAAFGFNIGLTAGLVAVLGSGVQRAWRAARAWRGADRGGGLAVSSQGVLHLAEVPRARIAGPVYRASELTGPWIPWAALRAVHRAGYGLVLEADADPAEIRLSPSTEGVAPLGQLLRELKDAWARANLPGEARVRVELGEALADDVEEVRDGREARQARRDG